MPGLTAQSMDAGVIAKKRRRFAFDIFLAPVLAQRLRLVLLVVSLAILSAALGVVLYAIKWLVPALFAPVDGVPEATLASAWVLPIIDYPVSRAQLAVAVPLVLVIAGILRAFALYLYSLEQQALAIEWARRYRERLFAMLLALPYVEIRRRSAGEWMSLLMNDVNFMQNRLTDVLAGVLRGGAQVLTGFVVLFSVHWPSALLLVAASPLVSFGMGRAGRRIARYTELFQRELGRIAGAVLDLRARFDFIRAQNGEARERERFEAINAAYYRMIRGSILLRSVFAPLLELLGFIAFAAFTWALAKRMLAVEPGDMLRFFAALGILLKPLRELGEQISRAQETRGVLRQTINLFVDLDHAAVYSPGQNTVVPLTYHQEIQIEHVQVSYAPGNIAFSATNLQLKPTLAVAIIGPSGAGKSTLLKVLAGLIEPQLWQATYPWQQVARSSSMVAQEPFLFDDSIAANLTYGQTAPITVDKDRMLKTLSMVNMHDEVLATSHALDSRVRAIGSNLSGGQMQRLTIARGLLRDRPIWLFDEATAAIDPRSEREITTRLIADCKAKGAILLAVTHRLQWLESYDEIWFVDDGQIICRGQHRQLLDLPRYRQFCADTAQYRD